MRKIIAGYCQFPVLPGDIEGNVRTVESRLPVYAKSGCRLLVLPEMWSCNFVYSQLLAMAERTPEVIERMSLWTREYGMVIVGSLPEVDQGVVYNTSYVLDPKGEVIGEYRKIHLFSLHGEHLHFGRGGAPLVCSTELGRVGVMICYDLRFPELARRLALSGAEIICVSALWPKVRIDHWSILLRSRAIENQLFIIGCNGSGADGTMEFGGASAVVSPTGVLLAEASTDGSPALAVMDSDELGAFRERIPCFEDRVPKAYGLDE